MEKKRKIKVLTTMFLVVAVLGLTVAFASLTQLLTITGTASSGKSSFDVYFENITNETINAKIEDIKKNYIVTNILMMATEATVRFIAKDKENIINGAEVTLPNVEDAYMYLMHINGGAR